MKIAILVPMFILIIWGCSLVGKQDEVKEFIPGVYVRHYTDEYTDSYDSIQIKPITVNGSDGYSVTKRTQYQKIDNDGKMQPGYEIKKWIGAYNGKNKTLWLEGPGKEIWFDPSKDELKIGAQPYKKL